MFGIVRQSTALIEQSQRCMHIGDRAGISMNSSVPPRQLLRASCAGLAWSRVAEDGKHTIATEMAEVQVQGLHRIEVRNRKGNALEAVL